MINKFIKWISSLFSTNSSDTKIVYVPSTIIPSKINTNKEITMSYILEITRDTECKGVSKPGSAKKEDSTLGIAKLINTDNSEVLWSGYTCENIGPSTDKSGTDKRIVAREYDLEWRASGKNASLAKKYPQYKMGDRNKALWLTCDSVLPGFRNRYILGHVGNYPQDTEGCLLFGKSRNTKLGTVSNSIEACHELFTAIDKVGIDKVKLKINEI